MLSSGTWITKSRYLLAAGRVANLIPHLVAAFEELETATGDYAHALEADMWLSSAQPAVRNKFLDQLGALRAEQAQVREALEAMRHAGE